MTDKLQLAVNHALEDYRMARARMGLLNPGGTGLDQKRDRAWCEYGFPENVSYSMLFNLYRRGGIANGAVNKLTGLCWKSAPEVIQGAEDDRAEQETPWERAISAVLTPSVWRLFADADRRRLVGRYSGLILRIRDGKEWDQPVEGGEKGLAGVIVAWAGALTVGEWDTDTASETYGQPKLWKYRETTINGQPGRDVNVHRDRVFILGDYSADAIGFLEPAYNAFVNLEKVEGGSGESFLKNAARQVAVNFDKETDLRNLASVYDVPLEDLHERFNEAAREINRGNDAMLLTQGASVSALVSQVPDPRPTYDVNLQTACAAMDIPSRILIGNQSGERASTEDQRYFNARCQARRSTELSFEIEAFVSHLVRIRVIKPQPRYAVIWDDLNESTATDKLNSAKVMSDINTASLATGEQVFDTDEIRTAAGFEPRDEGEPLGDTDGEEEDEDGQGADPTGEPGRPDRR
ncbi:anti-CBASS protein Acb1 family protein [Bordetella sp. BOR01]|uniref:anti-CBASS protein Acb1 family protein n=1 Tax=Bordetella sp. BOR01 TaxID=2854779 RepID=UPI001C48C732|nr:anti-CBASS Acb1 family protein [Bordetella sp. BOR01]MBV7482516.1 DUF1073 domain-containing protein [Bordetella sp. BOR01]